MNKKLVIFTGAGISADSGISTFRDSGGLWENESVDDVANFLTWKRNRIRVHRFYNERRTSLPLAQPNAAHHAVQRLQATYGAVVITQNIDDLFERAGCVDVVHVHGRLTQMQCTACGTDFEIGYKAWDPDTDRCPKCTSRKGVKPNVVFFHERAPLYKQMWKAFDDLRAGDVLLVVGTSGQVVDIGAVAKASYATTILSNLESASAPSMPEAPVAEDRQFDIVMHGRAVDRCTDWETKIAELLA